MSRRKREREPAVPAVPVVPAWREEDEAWWSGEVPDHPFLNQIRGEAGRLTAFVVTVDHLAEALGAPVGTAEFDGRLEAFCLVAGLAFDPVDDAMFFRSLGR